VKAWRNSISNQPSMSHEMLFRTRVKVGRDKCEEKPSARRRKRARHLEPIDEFEQCLSPTPGEESGVWRYWGLGANALVATNWAP